MYHKKYVECPTDIEPKYKLAHAYVLFQKLGDVYNPREALCKGTLFPELFMPYNK